MIDLTTFSDKRILACTAYGENRGGGVDGMQSVLNVIVNRANKPSWWGHTMREVCLKPYQFSCWLPDDPNYKIITTVTTNDLLFANACDMAQQAISGALSDITHGATYYFAKSMKQWPHWAIGHTPCADIANQLFFNDVQ